MHPVAGRFLRQTVLGVALIAVGVPFLEGRALGFTQVAPPALSITGDVHDLSVAQPGRLVLTLHNPGGDRAVVRRVEAAPREQVTGCRLSVEPFVGELVVPAGGKASQVLAVTIAGPRCVGASWQLDYAAS